MDTVAGNKIGYHRGCRYLGAASLWCLWKTERQATGSLAFVPLLLMRNCISWDSEQNILELAAEMAKSECSILALHPLLLSAVHNMISLAAVVMHQWVTEVCKEYTVPLRLQYHRLCWVPSKTIQQFFGFFFFFSNQVTQGFCLYFAKGK